MTDGLTKLQPMDGERLRQEIELALRESLVSKDLIRAERVDSSFQREFETLTEETIRSARTCARLI